MKITKVKIIQLPSTHEEECKAETLPPGLVAFDASFDYLVSPRITVLCLKQRSPGATDWSWVELSLRIDHDPSSLLLKSLSPG